MTTQARMTISDALAHGYKLQQAGKPAKAVEIYMRVIAEQPENPESWCYLGMALHDLKRYSDSEDAYRQALKLKPKFPVALNNLGNTLRMLGRTDEAMDSFDEAVRLKPGYVNAIRNKATALYWSGRLEEAEAGFLNVLGEKPDDAEAHKNLAMLRLLTGRHREGWSDYEFRWGPGNPLPAIQGERWVGQQVEGKTLMLVAEQGLGDTIQFSRYGAQLKEQLGCRVIACVQDALVPLLTGSASLMGLDDVFGKSGNLPDYDFWVPMLSIPGVLDQGEEDFPLDIPYIEPLGESAIANEAIAKCADGVLKIGLVWQGSAANQADIYRSFPLAELAPLARLEGVQLFSLQKGDGSDQADRYGEAMGLINMGQALDEGVAAFSDTAALLKQLDLVVCADTAVAHLAGAVGTPVWLALSAVPDWRWGLEEETTPWYSTIRLFRQKEINEWGPVFDEMARELDRLRRRVNFKQIPEVSTVRIQIPPGELIDRLTILEIKEDRITNEEKLAHVARELSELRQARSAALGEDKWPEVEIITSRLKEIHGKLWDAEDAVRKMESGRQFAGEFITVARSIYKLNDQRAALKNELNQLLGAAWHEAKSYDQAGG